MEDLTFSRKRNTSSFDTEEQQLKWTMSTFMVINRASQVAQLVKNLPVMQETPVRFLGWKDPLEKG